MIDPLVWVWPFSILFPIIRLPTQWADHTPERESPDRFECQRQSVGRLEPRGDAGYASYQTPLHAQGTCKRTLCYLIMKLNRLI